MNLTELKAKPRTRKRAMVRKGRGPGTGKGKTAGRGGKGASARTGFSNRYYFEGGQMPLVRRLPKFGFNNKTFRADIVVLNVRSLNDFEAGAAVGPEEFLKAGMINKVSDGVKVLGDGEVSRKLTVSAHRFSESARKKIEAAGGTCVLLESTKVAPAAAAAKSAKPAAGPKAEKPKAPAKAKAEKPKAPAKAPKGKQS